MSGLSYPLGAAYERLVNATGVLAPFRVPIERQGAARSLAPEAPSLKTPWQWGDRQASPIGSLSAPRCNGANSPQRSTIHQPERNGESVSASGIASHSIGTECVPIWKG
jgi:hypothetical protein